jgi:hypothetical protein
MAQALSVQKKSSLCQLMAHSHPSSLKLRRKGSSWFQEDPPSLKLRRGRQLMAENDPASLYRAMPDKSLRQAFHGSDKPAAMRDAGVSCLAANVG